MSNDPDDIYIPDPKLEEFHWAELFSELRWPNGFECRCCGSTSACHLKSRPRVWQCSICGAQTSVTANTILHRCRLPMRKIFLALLLFSRDEGISSNQLRRHLGTRYGTAWRLAHRFREALRHQQPIKAVATSAAGVLTLPEPGDEARPIERRVRLFGAMDGQGHLRVAIADREHELPLQQLLATVSVVRRRAAQVNFALADFKALVRSVHSRVSRRWLRFYSSAWASFRCRGDRFAWLVRHVMETPARSWADIVQPDVVGLSP